MTSSTDQFGTFTAPPPPAGDRPPQRLLRRSRTDRVGAGVAGGLGEYFSVDPVLFRVLFATAAFFAGAGVLAYLLAWAAIPEQGTVNAPVDRFVGELRRRRVPVWLVAAVLGLALWSVAFSWWAPGPFFPVMVVVIILVAIFGRGGRRASEPQADPGAVSLDKAATPGNATPGNSTSGNATPGNSTPGNSTSGNSTSGNPTPSGSGQADALADAPADPSGQATNPAWMGETRQWMSEARAASRERRRRAFPVRMATLGVLVLTLGILAAVDGASGIDLPVYFWVTLGIVVAALVVGMALRRTPWSIATLIVPSVAGLVAFGGTSAQLHDGFGQRDWTPVSSSALKSDYRLAFGQGVLDLRLVVIESARTVHITVAAGQVRLILPPTMNATVDANVHLGVIAVDGNDVNSAGGWNSRGMNINRTILPPATASGLPVTIDVHLADGNISVTHLS
ncbi:MAG: PspC domain-containing protein [Actinomycetota bacterium]|nr:PspC domain-containing protein [Actinomycetota bacterium]